MTIAYDGTHYSGWQVQPNARTIQEVIQEALATILKKPTSLIASGRTDAGVHARGQVAHFCADVTDPFRLLRSLNGLLPHDIRITSLEPAADSFHARFSAKRKTYHYHIHLATVHDPIAHPYRYHVRRLFDLDLAKRAASHFVGTHDFTAFANEANRGSAKTAPIKTLYRLDLACEPHGFRLEFEGSGFLYKMVRNIVGTILTVASGKLDPDAIPVLFKGRDRTKTPKAAPAHGLFLINVTY